jgi:hypothetical protein
MGFLVSLDRKKLLFTRLLAASDVMLIENFRWC